MGNWKTYLVEYFFNTYIKNNNKNKKWIPIWIKSTLFKDKIEIRDYIFKEIESILVNKGIIIYSFRKIINLFKSKTYGLDFFQETFEITREKLRNLLKILDDEYIVLVIDDLDRKESREVREIIGLVAEVEDFFNLKIIYLLDEENLKDNKIDKDFFEKYFSKKIELHKISYKDIIKSELKDTYPNFQVELINYFKALENVFLEIFINKEDNDENKENKKIATLVEDKINTPRKLIKFLKEIDYSERKKIENEANYNKLIKINTYFFYFLREISMKDNEEMIKNILKKVFIEVLKTYNIKDYNFEIFICDNFIDSEIFEGLIKLDKNKIPIVSKERCELIKKEYQRQEIKSFTELDNDIKKIISYNPIVENKKELIDNMKKVLIKSYKAKKIGLFEVIELYYGSPFQGRIDKDFINELTDIYFFSRRELSRFFYSIDKKFFRELEVPLTSIFEKKYIMNKLVLPNGIFDFTKNFLKEKMGKKIENYTNILDGLKDFKEEILIKIKLDIEKTQYNCEGYKILSSEKNYLLKKINEIIFQIDFLSNIFQKYESSRNSISYNSTVNITKLNIKDMKTVEDIVKNLITLSLNNYYSLYSYTGLDIKRNLPHIKEVLKNNEDYLYLLLSRFGLDINGNRIPHRIYNKVIKSLNKQGIVIGYKNAYFQGEVFEERKKIVKEYIIEQKLREGEELKENEITVLRVDYVENNEDKLLYIGTIGESEKEDYIKNLNKEVIFYIP